MVDRRAGRGHRDLRADRRGHPHREGVSGGLGVVVPRRARAGSPASPWPAPVVRPPRTPAAVRAAWAARSSRRRRGRPDPGRGGRTGRRCWTSRRGPTAADRGDAVRVTGPRAHCHATGRPRRPRRRGGARVTRPRRHGRRRGAGAGCGRRCWPPPTPRPSARCAPRGRRRHHALAEARRRRRRWSSRAGRGQVATPTQPWPRAVPQRTGRPAACVLGAQRAAYDDLRAGRAAAGRPCCRTTRLPAMREPPAQPVRACCSAPTPSWPSVPGGGRSPARGSPHRRAAPCRRWPTAELVGARPGGGEAVGAVTGHVVRVNGPLVEVEGLDGVAMSELVELGPQRLPGEVVAIRDGGPTVQAYEYTGGLAARRRRSRRAGPSAVRPLGPDLLGGVFDGLLRPLSDGADLARAGRADRPDRDPADATWTWQPRGDRGRPTVARARCSAPCRAPAAARTASWCRPAPRHACGGCAPPAGSPTPDPVARSSARTPVPLVHDWPVRRAAAGRASGSTRASPAADRPAGARPAVPRRPRQHRRRPRRLRHRQDHAAAADREVVRRRRHRLRRLRRARQRDGRRPRGARPSSPTRAPGDGSPTAPSSSPTPRTCR